MVRDGIVFKDEDGQVIFNQHSFCELVKHLLVELVGISYEEASQIVDRSPLAEPVADAMGVAMFSHDLPYYSPPPGNSWPPPHPSDGCRSEPRCRDFPRRPCPPQ